MIQKTLNEINIEDLNELVTNSVSEGRNLDYKRDLCGNSDADKKEFLSDISSFANATGGDLLFGVDEAEGAASAIVGLKELDADATILRLESSIRDGIEPRIAGVQFRVVESDKNGPVLIVRIPNSWASPHMVTFKGTSRFFSRGSAGKFQMDVAEIRSAFDATGLLSRQIAEWRTDRIGKVISGDVPFDVYRDSGIVLHLVPMASFDQLAFSATDLSMRNHSFWPINTGGGGTRLNLDGFVSYSGNPEYDEPSSGYVQVFRSGAVEAVSGVLVSERDGDRYIASTAYEKEIISSVEGYLRSMLKLGVVPPVLFLISLLGVKGSFMWVGRLGPVSYTHLTLPTKRIV